MCFDKKIFKVFFLLVFLGTLPLPTAYLLSGLGFESLAVIVGLPAITLWFWLRILLGSVSGQLEFYLMEGTGGPGTAPSTLGWAVIAVSIILTLVFMHTFSVWYVQRKSKEIL